MVELGYTVAFTANQVMVALRPDPLEGGITAAHIGLGDQVEVLQDGQRAVDGGDIDVRIFRLHPLEDVGGRHVAGSMAQRSEDHHPLRRHFVAGLSQKVDRFGLAAHRLHPLLQLVAVTIRLHYRGKQYYAEGIVDSNLNERGDTREERGEWRDELE